MLGCRMTRWLFLSLLLSLLLCGDDIARAAEGDTRLAIARAALRDYYTSIRSLRSEGVWLQKLTPEGEQDAAITGAAPIERLEWVWVQQGSQYRVELDGALQSDIPSGIIWMYYDGTHTWGGGDFVQRDGRWAPATYARSKKPPAGSDLAMRDTFSAPLRLTGLALKGSSESLADRFDDPQARFVGETTVTGVVCWEFDLGEYQSDYGEAVRLTVCLDPQHAFLPRSLAYTCSNPRASDRITTTEFFKIVDHATGGTRWFPREGVVSSTHVEQTARITSAEVNLSLGPADFQPPLPDGTLIRDLPAQPGGAIIETIVGGPEARRDIMEAQMAEAKLALPNPAALQDLPLVDASVRSAWGLSDILFYLCIGILILVVTVRVYQRSPQPR